MSRAMSRITGRVGRTATSAAAPSGEQRQPGGTEVAATGFIANDGPPMAPDYATVWMSQGRCRNYPPNVFFPSDGVGVDRARKICVDCDVKVACLEYALDERIEHGVWGGTSERERRRILKRRRIEVTVVADAALA
jgi:WhiB family transcriptional regulator, redox-sensing transcriptional regulator